MEGQMTLCLVQPEGMPNLAAMKNRIKRTGLLICDENEICWDSRSKAEKYFWQLYYRSPEEIVEAAVQHFLAHRTTVLLIGGTNAVEKFVQLAGRNANPCDCPVGSLRRTYGRREPIELGDGLRYWQNALYRSESLEAAQWDINLFFGNGLAKAS